MHPSSLARFGSRIRRKLLQFTWGGEWAISLSGKSRHNLFWFFFDGLFASASDNITVTYLVLFILALGGNRTQIGLMSSVSSFIGALLLLPGALLVEKVGHKKELAMYFGGGLSRLTLLILAFLPLFLTGQAVVWAAIGLSLTRDAFGNLAFPAWMSLTGEIVPIEGRGRYFGSRNFIMGITGMLAIILVGLLITRVGQPLGYQLALGLAFVFGGLSTYSFSHLKDPSLGRPAPLAEKTSLAGIITSVKGHPIFLALIVVMVVWNFSINIAGPFFNVFMVQNLKFTATMVGVISIVSAVASLLVQPRIGRLSDRWGPRKVQLVSMLIIPFMPALWIFATNIWHVIAINIVSGAVWGVFNLVSFNFVLSLIPGDQRARYAAIFQLMIMLALAGGAAIGAWVVTNWGYTGVFLASAIGRAIATFLFLRFVPDPLKQPVGL